MDASHAWTRGDPGVTALARNAQSNAARSWPSSSSASAAKRYQMPIVGSLGGCDADGLKDLFQPLLRLSDSREDICDLTLRRKEAWVEFEAALQRPHARLVLTAILLQQRQTVECGNRIRRLGQ